MTESMNKIRTLPSSPRYVEIKTMPKLTIRSETGEATSHGLVEETYTIGRSPENSADFANASPFQSRKMKRDPARRTVFAAAALAFLSRSSSA